MNIQIGDNVAQLNSWGVSVKRVMGINPKTIALADVYNVDGRECEFMRDPKQHPGNWRVAMTDTILKIRELSAQIDTLEKERRELFGSMPKVDIS